MCRSSLAILLVKMVVCSFNVERGSWRSWLALPRSPSGGRRVNSHFLWFISRLICRKGAVRVVKSVCIDVSSPTSVPPSRNNAPKADLASLMMGLIAKAKRIGPSGSPCWTHRFHQMCVVLDWRGDGLAYACFRIGRAAGYSLVISRKMTPLSKLLKAIVRSTLAITPTPCSTENRRVA